MKDRATTATSPLRSTGTLPTIDGWEPGNDYLSRVTHLLENWFLLDSGAVHGMALFRHLTSQLEPLPPAVDWRNYSRLCADGSPVEFCETLSRHPGSPTTYTCETGPYQAPPTERLQVAVRLAATALADIPGGPALVQNISQQLYPDGVAHNQLSLWVGAEHPAGKAPRIKLYFDLNWRTVENAWQHALNALAFIPCTPDGTTKQIFHLLATRGYPRMLALTIASSGRVAAKLYYRLGCVDLSLIEAIATLCRKPVEPFALYISQLLRSSRHDLPVWSDRNAGIGVSLDGDGGIDGLALYHYTSPYFRDDDDLRQRVLALSPTFQWDVARYRSTSRLIYAGSGKRLRSLLGFGVKSYDDTVLHLYTRSGYLAR